MRLSLIAVSATVLLSQSALALSLTDLKGEGRAVFMSPYGQNELCVIAKKWPTGVYKKGDVEDENELCSFDFYTNIGICPKYNSTNPGVLLLKPNDKYSKQAIDASDCNVDRMDVKTEAKYKQSISCSYTPSILAYYHMSRIFGGAGRVPVTVLRTMDKRIHQQLTDKAVRHFGWSLEVIARTWKDWAQAHRDPRSNPELFDSTYTQVYGALSDNPKKEERYTDVSGKGSYETRYSRFIAQKPFQRVASSKSVYELLGSNDFQKVAQTVLQMKDVSDMVLMDTLLNQQDRIGNIHYKFVWYYYDPMNPTKLERQKSDTEIKNDKVVTPPAEIAAMAGKRAVLTKEMLLKDNDCGVAKDNMMRKYSVLEKVRHMSYNTYYRFMAFEKTLTSPGAKDYFLNEMLFTAKNFATLQDNVAKAKSILKTNCQNRKLRFDVDLESYLPGAPQMSQACDI